MKKKLLSLLLVIAVIMTSVSMGFGSLVTTAGAANGGVEAINAFSLTQDKNAEGTSFNDSFTIKSKVSGYQIKVNSVTASIRYAENETDAHSTYNVSSASGAKIGTGGQTFSFTGNISAGLAGLIRYECNYDLLDNNGNVVYAGMTGYGYGAVSANGQQTGGVGTGTGEPGTKKPYYYESFAPLNSIYVQPNGFTLSYKSKTQWVAFSSAKEVTFTPYVEAGGLAPSTLKFNQIKFRGVNAVESSKTQDGVWCEYTPGESGYYNFTVFVYSPNSDDLHANVEMYYRSDDVKSGAQKKLDEYLGAGLEKSYYTADSWNNYLKELEKVALCAMAIPGPNYAFRLACQYAADTGVANGGKLYDAREALKLLPADYTAMNEAVANFGAVSSQTVSVTTYNGSTTGTEELGLYTKESIDEATNWYSSTVKENLYKYDQKTVDGYTATIKDKTANLTYSNADYTYLDIAIQEYKNTENLYTNDTWIKYKAAAESAEALSRSLKANSQAEVNGCLASLVETKNALEYREANTDELNTQIAIANVIRSEKTAGTLYEEKAHFNDVWAMFEQAYNEAITAQSYKIIRQNEVDAAAEKLRLLNDALANYRVLDTNPLQEVLAKKPEYDESKYVPSSYQKWKGLRSDGYDFVDYANPEYECLPEERKTYADLEEMNRFIELVNNALENLEKVKADFTELRGVVALIPPEEELALYKDEVVKDIKATVAKIDYGATFDRQTEVDKWAADLSAALAFLTEENYKDADYSGVEAAIAEANALDRTEYRNFEIVDEAINAVDWTKKIVDQDDVDAMEKAIREAVAGLGYVLADYTEVNKAIAEAEAVENKDWYSNYYRVENIIANIDWNVTLEDQEEVVDAYAAAIREEIKNLKLKDADYSGVEAAIAEANRIKPLTDFKDEFGIALNDAIAAVQAGYTIKEQATVDAMADRINAILATADDNLKDADYTKVNVAVAYAESYKKTGDYKNYDEVVQPVIDAIDWELKCRDTKDKQHVKIMQDQIDAIYDAVKKLELKDADYTDVYAEIKAARAVYADNEYAEFPYSQESIDAVEAIIRSINLDYTIREQDLVDEYVFEIREAVKNLKYARADYSELDAVLAQYEALERDRYTAKTLEAVDKYVAKIDMDITVDRKDEVAAYVTGLTELLGKLEYLPADYTRIINAENEFKVIKRENQKGEIEYYYYDKEYIDAVEDALEAVEYGLTKEYQDDVNAMADAVETALNTLKANKNKADLTALYDARDAANAKQESMEATGYTIDQDTVDVLLDQLNKIVIYNEYTEIDRQEDVDKLTAAIIAATENLEFEFQILWDKSGLITEGSGGVNEGSYVYGFEEGVMAEDARELIKFVGAARMEIIETANGFGTGTVIKFKSTKDNSTLAEYTVLVFGDANGDAVVDTFDVAYIAEVVNSGEDPDAVTLRVLDMANPIYEHQKNENGETVLVLVGYETDGYIDALDVAQMISYANMDQTLKQDGSNEPDPAA